MLCRIYGQCETTLRHLRASSLPLCSLLFLAPVFMSVSPLLPCLSAISVFALNPIALTSQKVTNVQSELCKLQRNKTAKSMESSFYFMIHHTTTSSPNKVDLLSSPAHPGSKSSKICSRILITLCQRRN